MEQATLMKSIMGKLGFAPEQQTITLTDHVRIVAEKVGEARKDLLAEAQQERETSARLLERNITLQGRVDVIEAANHGLLRDKLAESDRAKSLAAELAEVMKTIEALRPDAEKHRERLRRDREYVANKRARNGETVA